MKTHARIHRHLTLAPLAAALLLAAPNVPAQSQPAPTASAQSSSVVPSNAGTFDITIRDGIMTETKKPATVGNIVQHLREKKPDLNFVLSPGTAEIQIGDLQLRSATVHLVMQSLGIASDGSVLASPVSVSAGREPESWMIRSRPSKKAERNVEVFNISGYLTSLMTQDQGAIDKQLREIQRIIADSLAAVRNGEPGAGEPTFQFHGGTSLLIVIGPPDAIEVARKVVNALPGQSAAPARDRAL